MSNRGSRDPVSTAESRTRSAFGFFYGRRVPEYGYTPARTASDGLVEYVNVPRIIGALISSGRATLLELQTVYGMGDAYNLLEIVAVDGYNTRKAQEKATKATGT